MSDFPALPERIAGLHDLATDLWWVWHPDAVELFRRLDRKLWEGRLSQPRGKLLGAIDQKGARRGGGGAGYLPPHGPRVERDVQGAPEPAGVVQGAPRRQVEAARSLISAPSSACMSRCRFIPAAWASSRAITSSLQRAGSALRRRRLLYRRDTSTRASPPTGGRRRTTRKSTENAAPSSPDPPTARSS